MGLINLLRRKCRNCKGRGLADMAGPRRPVVDRAGTVLGATVPVYGKGICDRCSGSGKRK
jgi:hypothetical protein